MQIDSIKQTELTQSQRDVLKQDTARWERMGGGGHLDDWLAYQPGLMIRRQLAMRIAFVNRPEGKGYAQAFAQLMKSDGLDHMDKTSISALLWLGDEAERMQMLRELREAMTPGRRSRLNSPISARQLVEKALKARQSGTEETEKMSPVALHKQTIMEQAREIEELKLKLAKASDGSLFDLKKDNADDIATVIVNSVGAHKAKAIASGIAAWLKPKPKPAG
jgi:hypothetical protein